MVVLEEKTEHANIAPLQLVALGANVSITGRSLERTLSSAIKAIAEHGFVIRAVSRFYRTPCFPSGAGPDYINAALALQSGWSAAEALVHLHRIEADFGRERVQRWGQRTLDLDLIAMGDQVLPSVTGFNEWFSLDPEMQAKAAPNELVLPHPRIQDRAFVLAPLADVAPDWHHPVLGKTTTEMLAELPATLINEVVPI